MTLYNIFETNRTYPLRRTNSDTFLNYFTVQVVVYKNRPLSCRCSHSRLSGIFTSSGRLRPRVSGKERYGRHFSFGGRGVRTRKSIQLIEQNMFVFHKTDDRWIRHHTNKTPIMGQLKSRKICKNTKSARTRLTIVYNGYAHSDQRVVTYKLSIYLSPCL